LGQAIQSGGLDEAVFGAGVRIHHLHGRIGIAEVIGVNDDEIRGRGCGIHSGGEEETSTYGSENAFQVE